MDLFFGERRKSCSCLRPPRTGLDERAAALIAEHPTVVPGAKGRQVRSEQADQLRWDRHDPHRVGGSSLERTPFASLAVVSHSCPAQDSDPVN
jgi:hypothetical protein